MHMFQVNFLVLESIAQFQRWAVVYEDWTYQGLLGDRIV